MKWHIIAPKRLSHQISYAAINVTCKSKHLNKEQNVQHTEHQISLKLVTVHHRNATEILELELELVSNKRRMNQGLVQAKPSLLHLKEN